MAEPDKPAPTEEQEPKAADSGSIGGYRVEELIKAPIQPPGPHAADSRQATESATPKAAFALIIGSLLLIVSLVLMFAVSLWVGVAAMVFSAVVVIASLFLPIR